MAHLLNLSTWDAEEGSEFKASLVYSEAEESQGYTKKF